MLSFASGLVSPFVSVLLRDLGASFLDVGKVASGYNLALAITAFLGGSLCAKFGGRVSLFQVFCLACLPSFLIQQQLGP